jgi:hypothetical protein
MTAADRTGAQKYPARLNISWLIEDEAAWYSLLTEFTTTPVAVGMRAAPKKRRDQSRGMMYTRLLRNPIGAAKIKASAPKPVQSLIAVRTFFPL